MSMFIRVEIDPEVASQPDLAKKLVDVCPVDIFALDGNQRLVTVEENLDECTLCDLCIQTAPPGTVRVIKLYE